ncbi:HD domain-containing phosphohydrolase [Psychromonas aquimarina]|uniref:HD domain-containing phosphohydrolase n=1 Tax=Psychromonas aquimarina TaxID=444919 RepID=UPI0004261804|nr:HD domain-containing phosphohydrolase [Psychromonas aquimarina]
MSKTQVKHRFTLHFHITTLFTVLILLSSSLVGWYSYKQLSQSIIDSGKLIFKEANEKLEKKVLTESLYTRIMLKILAASELTENSELKQKQSAVAQLKEMLDGSKNIKALFIAYSNDDFFLFRKIVLGEYAQEFNAPAQSSYMLTQLNNGDAVHYFYDQNLKLTLEVKDPSYQLESKSRPWYIEAQKSSQITTTDAYIFYSSQELGITMAKYDPDHGAVIGADYTLSDLSDLLKEFQSSPNSQQIIVNKSGQVIAYQNKQSLLSKSGKLNRLKLISEMDHPVLQYAFEHYKNQHNSIQFTYNGRQWLGKVSRLRGNDDFYLAQLVPLDELLADAYQLRFETTVITLLIILLTLPVAWYFSKILTSPIRSLTKELKFIKNFDFSRPIKTRTLIKEINELVTVTSDMKETISNFQDLSASLVGKQSFQQLLEKITHETLSLSHAKGAVILLADKSNKLNAAFTNLSELTKAQNKQLNAQLKTVDFTEKELNQLSLKQNKSASGTPLPDEFYPYLQKLFSNADALTWQLLPLANRSGKCLGMLAVINDHQELNAQGKQSFIQAIASFSALAVEAQLLLAEQKALLQSFIHLIAGAIDSQSSYTGGHCARVPELTKMLTQAACRQEDGQFKDFSLNDEQWEELHIAAWLHDCGKIVTPEYIVDKATKLETIYDRIHEVRMRFELLKQQAHSSYWKGLAEGQDKEQLLKHKETILTTLDEEFAFVAECNIGGEFMSDDKIQRLNKIAQRTWTRTLDNKLGLSRQEKLRHKDIQENLPVEEPLLSDRAEHLIKREHAELTAPGNPWGFNMKTPQYRFNRGELYNLSIQRGTLTDEDRFVINGHMVHTIVMLSQLPFPKHLENVPVIAGGHHEKIDGTGYPRAVPAQELPVTARMMVIADIFEALTASDRPYKERKTLSQSIKIMSFMVKDKHIDEQIFKLFLSSGTYLQYARQYLLEEQIDEVDLSVYLDG